MGEYVYRVLLSELATVRIVCKCGAVLEIKTDDLDKVSHVCTVCDNSIGSYSPSRPEVDPDLRALKQALHRVAKAKDSYTLEFVISGAAADGQKNA